MSGFQNIRSKRERSHIFKYYEINSLEQITKSDLSIAILTQCCMSIPQFDPNLTSEKPDLPDTVKRELDFFLDS